MRKASEKDRAFEARNDSSERAELAIFTSCPLRHTAGHRWRVPMLRAANALGIAKSVSPSLPLMPRWGRRGSSDTWVVVAIGAFSRSVGQTGRGMRLWKAKRCSSLPQHGRCESAGLLGAARRGPDSRQLPRSDPIVIHRSSSALLRVSVAADPLPSPLDRTAHARSRGRHRSCAPARF